MIETIDRVMHAEAQGVRSCRLDQVRAMGFDILASNMRANGWPTVIRCRTGNWQPFDDDDRLLEVA